VLLSIVLFFGMLLLLVFVHELGHFLTARWLGIEVVEFGIGFPPRAATLFERQGVRYTLNWLPIGGFVRFAGEDDPGRPDSLAAATAWKRILVLIAGPGANLVLALLVFIGLYATVGITATNGLHVKAVEEGSPASIAGIQAGDVVVAIAGESFAPVQDARGLMRHLAATHADTAVSVSIVRDGKEQTLQITPLLGDGGTARFGIRYEPAEQVNIRLSPGDAIIAGLTTCWDVLHRMVISLGVLLGDLVGLGEGTDDGKLAGPVGIARATGEIIEAGGLLAFTQWVALFSLNLFLLNLLPIPALDGSHITFALVEMLRGGKKLPPGREAFIHSIGFVALLGLMALLSVSDINQAVQGIRVLGE